jgi:dTDP-4-amino-4,6-dideoxygalactose transaminase
LAGIKAGDEVLVPVFTCTATNIPLLYIGAKPVFIDINLQTLNLDLNNIESNINYKTKAIVCVDYGGVPNDYENLQKICKKYNLKLIADSAHSLGSKYKNKYIGQLADFTIFSFQAIKTLTTGDGGMLVIKDKKLLSKAKKLRWFGINREKKQNGVWENDISDIGFKYQMNDISASIGISSLESIDKTIMLRNELFQEYEKNLKNKSIKIVGKSQDENYFNSSWLITILTDERIPLMQKLRSHKIESGQVHYRNDRYSIFGKRNKSLINMNAIEDKYLVLPLHLKMKKKDVRYICDVINNA